MARRPGYLYDGVVEQEGWIERWDGNQKRLAAELGAQHYVSAEGGHLMTEDDPVLIARAVDAVTRVVR